ncbi:MAG: amino acid adenylation domain-containing protein [Pyrinomonadaceae bacterium]
MTDFAERLSALSPEQRALFELRSRQKRAPKFQKIPALPRETGDNSFPLSFAQQRLWFLDQLEPGSPSYNDQIAVRLTGKLNVSAFEQALNEIVKRHEVLRTTIAASGGEPAQVIAPHEPLSLPLLDLRELPTAEREAQARQITNEELNTPFDLAQGPLWRARLLQLSEEEQVFLLTIHHIITDGWSAGVLNHELTALYNAFSKGRRSPLPELAIQYADYAAWQREWLQGATLETELDYWKRHLADAPETFDLPADYPRPPAQSYRGATLKVNLPKPLLRPLKELAQGEGATLFMTTLAAFQTLLYRYTGREDIVVGTAIAGRNRAEVEELIGIFINTLALRTDLSGDPSFRELLGRVRRVALGAYAHQEVPFEKLVEELQPQRDMSRTPLFQVMFDLENNVTVEAGRPSGLGARAAKSDNSTAKFDLTLMVTERAEELSVEAEYSTDLFAEASITRLLRHFETLLEGIVADPDRRISLLPMLTRSEEHQLIVSWNETDADYPRQTCVHDLFAAQAERCPENIAVSFGDERLTYEELNRRSNQLAHHLRGLGVGPEVPVAICMERSLEMVVSVLGILKAGGAYVPLDPTYPAERLSFMVEQAQTPVLLTSERMVESVPKRWEHVVRVDADRESISRESEKNPISGATALNAAYVVFTSGSTGRPKGVVGIHRALVNFVVAAAADFKLQASDRVLQFASYCFDVFLQELFPTWLKGAAVVLRDERPWMIPSELSPLLEQEQVTCLELPTAYWHQWLVEMRRAGQSLPSSLRFVATGTEKPLPERLAIWQSLGLPLCHVYGLTEAAVNSAHYWLPADAQGQEVVPIGRPIANNQIYLLDNRMQPVPIGHPGEVYIGGECLARCYVNRADLTAERFLPDPFGRAPGARLYKTGDLARYLPDGNIEFLGRIDFQVSVRGFRVELGEIEATLSAHPVVRETVVVAREYGPGDKRLVAYIVAEKGSAASAAEVRAFLRERLPEHMIPPAFVFLDEFPLTANGKVNRLLLPAPDSSRADDEQTFVAPRTPVEEMLGSIWASVLKIERVGSLDNFFDLGGHSLLATQVISRIRDLFRVSLQLRSIFESSNLSELALKIEAAMHAGEGNEPPPLVPVTRERELPLSFAQQRLWFLDQLQPGASSYNVPDAVRLHGPIKLEALEKTLNEITRRHEVVRTTYAMRDGRPAQVIAPAHYWRLPVVDLSSLPEAEREAEARRLASEESYLPFDLARGPLLRVTLLKLEEETHVVLLTMHHIISDAWSLGVFVREVTALYQAFSQGQPSPLAELPIQYADFAAWQRSWLQGEVLESELSYWRRQLEDAPDSQLSTARARPASSRYRGAHLTFRLPDELSESLRNLSRGEGATLFMTLVAALQTLLYRYTGQDDIVIGTPIAGRNRAEIENLIGFFVNTLVLRTKLSGEIDFRELLKRVREVCLGAYAHQDVPFEKLVEELRPERAMGRQPLFQVVFAFDNTATAPPVREQSVLTVRPFEFDNESTMFDLIFAMVDTTTGLSGSVHYNTDLFDDSMMALFVAHFKKVLGQIAAHPETLLADISLVEDEGRDFAVSASQLLDNIEGEQFNFQQ